VVGFTRNRPRWWCGCLCCDIYIFISPHVGLPDDHEARRLSRSVLRPSSWHVYRASDRASEGNLDIWVQLLAGGEPSRLTRHAADDREPSFSPDGSKIAFRSDRDRGGIYVVSTARRQRAKDRPTTDRAAVSRTGNDRILGGEPGTMPLFGWGAELASNGHVRCVPCPARGHHQDRFGRFFAARIRSGPPTASILLIEGVDKFTAAEASSRYDWYVAALDSGALVKTGAFDVLRKYNLFPQEPGMLTLYPARGLADDTDTFSRPLWETRTRPLAADWKPSAYSGRRGV